MGSSTSIGNQRTSGPAEPLLTKPYHQVPSSWSPDGQTLAFVEVNPTTVWDSWFLPRGGEPVPFLVTEAWDRWPAFSPDGHRLAYESDGSGQVEIYVRPYPGPGGVVAISTGGGKDPVWSRDGRELFYRQGNQMLVVAVEAEPRFTVGAPQVLFAGRYSGGAGSGPGYDVFPDGHFLMIELVEQTDETSTPPQIIVVENWDQELVERVPVP